MRSTLILSLTLALPAMAQDLPLPLPLSCFGDNPDWALNVTDDGAVFNFQRQSELDLMLDTPAHQADYPRALTLVGRGDSAIVIIEPQRCETGPLSARVLTQRGETPILLTGCCSLPDH